MKDWKFVKIGNSKVGNADKEFKTEEELRQWCINHQYYYTPTHGGYYLLENDSPTKKQPVLSAHVSAVGNSGFDLREPDPTGKMEAEARARLRKEQWKDVYKHFMSATQSELSNIKTKQDAINFLVKKGENANDIAVVEAVKKFIGNESIQKQEWSMFNGLTKDAEKEIGNETYQHKLYPDKYVIIDGKNYKIITDGKVEKSGELTDAILYGINQTYKRVSSTNSKTVNKAIVLKDGKVWVVLYANETKSQEFESEAEAREFAKKVGNENPEEMEVKYKGYKITYFPYQKKYMVRHPSEVSGLMQKNFTSVDEAKKEIDKKVGNAILGKFLMAGGHTATLVEEGGKFIIKYDDGRTETFMTRKAAEAFLKVHSELYIGNKVGNETKAEEKFGKVMGEYKEGALKTPQGKTVTDPAQAKAIAYSEADKVDNLKRARNAMKTGNSDITLWKGHDSAYIKEDGHVQYLENNAFVVEEDKYNSQEQAIEDLTKKGYHK